MVRIMAVFALAIFAAAVFGASCPLSVERSIEPNKSISVLSLVVKNAGANSSCDFGRFNATETFPQSFAQDTGLIAFSLAPASLSSHAATWSFGRLGAGESAKITYSIAGWVNPARLKDFGDLSFSFKIPEYASSNESGNITFVPVGGADGAYFAMRGGVMVAIAKSTGNNGSVPALVAGKAEIERMLKKHYAADSSLVGAIRAAKSAHEAVQKFSLSREPQEGACKILIGTDRNKCDSFDSCQYSCYSVTSFCFPIAIGSGRYLIESIWALENQTKSLTSSIDDEKRAFARLDGNFTYQNLIAYRNSAGAVNRAAGIALSNEVIGWLCPVPEYDFAGLTIAQSSLEGAAEKMAPLEGVPAEASAYAEYASKEIEKARETQAAIAAAEAAKLAQNNSAKENPANASAAAKAPQQESAQIQPVWLLASFLLLAAIVGVLMRKFGKRKK